MEENTLLHPKETFIQLWKYIAFYKKKLIVIVILTILSTIIGVLTPYFLSFIIDHALGQNMKKVIVFSLILFFMYMMNVFITRITSKSMLKISENILYQIRKDLFVSLEKKSISFFDKHVKGDIMSHFTSDLEVVNDCLDETIIDTITSVLTLIGTFVMMLILNIPLTIVTVFTVPIFFICALQIGKKTGNAFKKQQNDIGKLNAYFEEHITDMRILQSFHVEEKIKKEFQKQNEVLMKDERKAQFLSNLIIPFNNLVSNLGNFLILMIGSILAIKGNITIGVIFAFLSYASMFRSPIQSLASIFTSIESALAGAERIFAVIHDKNINLEMKKAKKLDKFKQLDFKNVTFGYERENIIKDVTFSLKNKESIAIVGKTGSGKTTLIQLILRFYDVSKGTILINQTPIKEFSYASLYQKIGVILQEPFLFEGTVLDNLLYGNESCTLDDVLKASIETGLNDFVEKLPNGYSFYIEENGTNISIGEKQLIAITRIVLRNPELLILDEATSSTDLYTEKKVYEAMLKLMSKRTTIVIAHRLKTIEKVDKILYLENGKIVESGTHSELLEKKGKYYKLYKEQFT